MICPPVEAEASTAAAKAGLNPERLMTGIVITPVETTFEIAAPDKVPKSAEEATAAEGLDLHAGERRGRAAFVEQDVRAFAGEHDVSGTGVDGQRRLVGHGAAGEEAGPVLAQQLSDALLEQIHARLVAQHVIAQGRGAHRLPHRSSRAGDSIGTQVDRVVHERSSPR